MAFLWRLIPKVLTGLGECRHGSEETTSLPYHGMLKMPQHVEYSLNISPASAVDFSPLVFLPQYR